jgi:hypothetical protein
VSRRAEQKKSEQNELTWLSLAVMTAVVVSMPLVRAVAARSGRRPLQAFAQAAERAGTVVPRPLGLREIPVAQVVGSVGRARELGTDFRPLRWRWDSLDDERYQQIESALRRGLTLPPITVYLLDSAYYVLDGHHRVAAARALGQVVIDAEVTEYRPLPRLALLEATEPVREAELAEAA